MVKTGNLAWRKIVQAAAFALIWLAGILAVVALVFVIGYVMIQGLPLVDLEFLTTRPAGGVSGEGGMSTTIPTTIYVVILVSVLSTPLGVGAAIYLAEYAAEAERESRQVRVLIRTARTGIELLAGVPSIVFGLFGFLLFVNYLGLKFSLLSGGLAATCLVLPTMIRASEEALLAVPRDYRSGSLALGATKWQTITQVVLPAAAPGIVTGIILTIGRVVAETAVFWVTIGGTYRMPTSLMSAGRTMALHVYMLATETRAFEKAMATSAVLIITIIILNLLVNYTSRRLVARSMGRK